MTDPIAQKRLFEAVKLGDKAAIRRLVFEDVDFNARDDQERTPFNLATQLNLVDVAQTILAAKQMKALHAMGMMEAPVQRPAATTGKTDAA